MTTTCKCLVQFGSYSMAGCAVPDETVTLSKCDDADDVCFHYYREAIRRFLDIGGMCMYLFALSVNGLP